MTTLLADRDIELLADRDIEIITPDGVDEKITVENNTLRKQIFRQSNWLPMATKQLYSLLSLKANWDGYGADAPLPELVRSAVCFLEHLQENVDLPIPHISPTRTGGVLFEWENGPHEMEVEIVQETKAEYAYLNTETNQDFCGYLPNKEADDGWFLQQLNRFFAS